jgi:hypothetical protein
MKNSLRDTAKPLIVLGTLFFNFFLIWILLYDPFSLVLLDKNQPYYIPEPHSLIVDITMSVIALLIITSIVLLVRGYKQKRIFYFAPLLTLLTIVAISIVSVTSLKYPSSTTEWFENRYYYKMEIWWGRSDNKKIYKRWKSVLPYNGKSNPNELKYKLDSLSITADN